MRGCAEEVIGEMAASEVGSVWLLGKRIGEMNGLPFVFSNHQIEKMGTLRVIETCCLGKTVNHIVCGWPGES